MVENGHSHKTLQRYAKSIGLKFKNTALLRRALTHSSYAYESNPPLRNNERLEFLGDAVLGLSVTHYLVNRYQDQDEGFLARIKSIVVSEPILAQIAARLDIGTMVLLGKGEILSGGGERPSILADTMEALLGASYLDGGYQKIKTFILKEWVPTIDRVVSGEIRFTYRSELQEKIQKHIKSSPDYTLVTEKGPDNDKTFLMEVAVGGIVLGRGEDRTKKGACQLAAAQALLLLQEHYGPDGAPLSIVDLQNCLKENPSSKKQHNFSPKKKERK